MYQLHIIRCGTIIPLHYIGLSAHRSSDSRWRLIFSLPISTFSALGVSHVMRSINVRYLLFYLLKVNMYICLAQIFSQGMKRELNVSHDLVERLFARLDDLIDIHLTFLQSLIRAQQCSTDKSIEAFGPLLLQQVRPCSSSVVLIPNNNNND